MKTLILIRHAKTSWANPAIEDHERPLVERGEHNAASTGDFLKKKNIEPDIILSSAAKRAKDTASIIANQLNYPQNKLDSEEAIYEAGVEELLEIIQGLDNKIKTAILVGHNPGLTMLANYLAEDHIPNLPTCGVYCVNFNTSKWSEIRTVEGNTVFLETPKHEE